MFRWRFALVTLVSVCVFFAFAGCAARRPAPCLIGDPGVRVMTVQFVCPYLGASYETTVVKCPGDRYFRIDLVCALCGRRHHYSMRDVPYPYRWNDFYFYNGWWYQSHYWQQHWPYRNHSPSYRPRSRPGQSNPPPIRPPDRPIVRPPDRPPVNPSVRRPENPPQRSRQLQSPIPPIPRNVRPSSPLSRLPRPGPIRVAPVSPHTRKPDRKTPPVRPSPPPR